MSSDLNQWNLFCSTMISLTRLQTRQSVHTHSSCPLHCVLGTAAAATCTMLQVSLLKVSLMDFLMGKQVYYLKILPHEVPCNLLPNLFPKKGNSRSVAEKDSGPSLSISLPYHFMWQVGVLRCSLRARKHHT